jgi:CDP-diacylglycerol--serine O-phosphatidyltransferase
MELMGAAEAIEQRPPARRGMYILPSLFTSGSIALGYYVIMQSIRGATAPNVAMSSVGFDHAALAIAFAIVFDGLDGRIARMTNTSSAFGKELDSLADVITFGVAPSLLAYLWGVRQVVPSGHPAIEARLTHFGLVVCFLFLICGACRLARFNISIDPKPRNPGRPGRKYFVGMPIPAGAGVIAAVIHFEAGAPIDNLWMSLLWLGLVGFVGFLMVSSWRFWSGKEIDMGERKPGRLLVFLVVLMGIIFEWDRIALLVIALGYLVSGVMARLAYSWKRRFANAN